LGESGSEAIAGSDRARVRVLDMRELVFAECDAMCESTCDVLAAAYVSPFDTGREAAVSDPAGPSSLSR
jgi:hypothetical protein